MITANKVPRVFGRQIVEATLVGKRHGANTKQPELAVYFTMGHGECEIYSTDWKKCFHSFQIGDATAEMDGENVVHFSYTRNNQPFECWMKYERCDLVLNAFSGKEQRERGPAAEGGAMSQISFNEILTFAANMPVTQASAAFKPLVEAQARKRVLFLSSSTEISESLIQAIAIEFRIRFPQIEPENWTEAFEVLWFEFVAFCVSLWTQCLKAAIEPHTGPNSFEYFRRLAASIASLIAKGADIFLVDRREFLLAVRKFLDTGDPSDIPASSRKIVADVELALGNIRKRWLLQLSDLFEFTQLFSIAIAIAQSVTPEGAEIKRLTSLMCSWAISLVNNLTRGPRINDFRIAVENMAVYVLRATNEKRYSTEFHCTLALWKLSELVKASD